MRLLYIESDGRLSWTDDLIDDQSRPYAILSHTWGKEEVTFKDLKNHRDIKDVDAKLKDSYQKIFFCAQQAKRDNLKYFWVDTCCIDKSNSTELSEAINSMFRWYRDAEKCYVYLSDVKKSTSARDGESALKASRWFTRGWTLQELLAPKSVEFFSEERERLGNKQTLELTIHEITKIPLEALQGRPLSSFSVDERFSWAGNRQTTREEDEVYCLLGIFNIFLPLIYGEKRFSAMRRLMKELEPPAMKPLQAIKENTEAIGNHLPLVTVGIETIRQNQDVTEHRRLLDWISASDYPSQQSDIIKRRQEGTGQWFLDAPELGHWLSKVNATLFCPGIPGAGKTMIAAIAIEHLLNTAQDSSCGVAYVYCNYKAQDEQDVSSLLAAILKQLAQGQLSAVKHIQQLYQKHAGRGTKPSLDEIYGALRDVLAHYPSVYIVIDALDECQRDVQLQFLKKLRDLHAQRDVRLLVTARFIPHIEDAFREALKLEVQASSEDVKRFVAGQTDRLPACIRRSTELQEKVQEKIVKAVDGMFLLARLHTDSLLDKRTTKDVRTTLDKLKKGAAALDDAYGEALQRIDGQLGNDRELARKVLSWITLAERPLTTAEICCALAVEPDEDEIDPENLHTAEDLVSVCAGLVVVDQESAIIRLVHYTTQEYFERTGDAWNQGGQLRIATTCLAYLSFSTFQSGSCSTDEKFEERLQQHVFLDYASKHWGSHARPVEAEVTNFALELLQGESFSCIVQIFSTGNFKYRGYSTNYTVITVLHYTAWLGLAGIARSYLAAMGKAVTEAVNVQDSRGDTPLAYAARNGHYEMANMLLNKGADVNAQGGIYSNALQVASAGGYEQVVKMLLDQGAEVNAQGGEYGNALYAASAGGHKQVVEMLLNRGAEANAQGGHYGNALQAASAGGYEQVVEMLLNQGAEVNVQGRLYSNALYTASAGGHEQVVKMLLDQGTDINAQGGRYGNALQAASAGGYEQVVEMLLDKGADVNAQGGHFGNALQAASAGGHKQVVEMLLNKGADVNAQGGRYSNALQAASWGGHEQIVETLLDKGADVNAQGGQYSNALQAASAGGDKQVVKMLIDKGADVNAQGGIYGNALYVASAEGHKQVVQMLLDQGAEVNAQGGHYSNALQAASARGYEQVVEMLLDQGADVNAQGGIYGNALQAASAGGYEQVVEMLLDKDAEVNAQGGHYSNALQAASAGGYEQVVEMLLDKDAEVNAQGGEYGNALQAASAGGYEQVVEMLLDKDAEVNAQGGIYGNALQAASAGGYEQVVEILLNAGAHQRQEDDTVFEPK